MVSIIILGADVQVRVDVVEIEGVGVPVRGSVNSRAVEVGDAVGVSSLAVREGCVIEDVEFKGRAAFEVGVAGL